MSSVHLTTADFASFTPAENELLCSATRIVVALQNRPTAQSEEMTEWMESYRAELVSHFLNYFNFFFQIHSAAIRREHQSSRVHSYLVAAWETVRQTPAGWEASVFTGYLSRIRNSPWAEGYLFDNIPDAVMREVSATWWRGTYFLSLFVIFFTN